MNSSINQLWDRYRALNPTAPVEIPISFHFCDNQEDADICAELVWSGKKRATAPSVAELELAGDPIPRIGDLAIVTNWAGDAVAIIRTVSVTIKSFGDIDDEFARAEAEGDLTLEWWRAARQSYYENVLTGSRYKVDDNLQIVCEHFELALRA